MPLQQPLGSQQDAGLQDRIGAILRATAEDARGGRAGDALSRVRIREACLVAKAHGIRAEELIIAVKRRWWSPDAETIALRNTEGLLARVVTLCIQEYYAADATAADSQSARTGST